MSELTNDPNGGRHTGERVLKSRMRVAEIRDGWSLLKGERAASCSSCSAKAGCGVNAVSELIGQAPPQICMPAHHNAAVGDDVVVSISGNEFLQLTMLAYLLPAAALVATACLSTLAGLGDIATAILSMTALAIAFLPLRRSEQQGLGLSTLAVESFEDPDHANHVAAGQAGGVYPFISTQNGNRQ